MAERRELEMRERAYEEWLPKYHALSEKYGMGKWDYSSKYYTDLGALHSVMLYPKDDGMLLVSTEGDEHLITPDTMDRVRDICWGNLRSLSEDDMRILDKYGTEDMLRYLSECSVGNYIKKNIPEAADAAMPLMVIDLLMDFMIEPDAKIIRSEDDYKRDKIKKSEEFLKKNFDIDIKLKYPDGMLSQLISKGLSDISFERDEFAKRMRYKTKPDDGENQS